MLTDHVKLQLRFLLYAITAWASVFQSVTVLLRGCGIELLCWLSCLYRLGGMLGCIEKLLCGGDCAYPGCRLLVHSVCFSAAPGNCWVNVLGCMRLRRRGLTAVAFHSAKWSPLCRLSGLVTTEPSQMMGRPGFEAVAVASGRLLTRRGMSSGGSPRWAAPATRSESRDAGARGSFPRCGPACREGSEPSGSESEAQGAKGGGQCRV